MPRDAISYQTQLYKGAFPPAPKGRLLGIIHRMVFCTNSFSNRPTSCLKVSTSFQQSSGRRSWVLRHETTASFAFVTSASACSSFFLCSNLALSCSISLVTLSLLMSFCRCFSARVELLDVASWIFSTREGSSDCWLSPERVSLNLEKFCVSCSRSFSSSAVRRSWYWSSCCLDRAESVYALLAAIRPCEPWNLRKCSSAAIRRVRWRSCRGDLCAQIISTRRHLLAASRGRG